MECVLPGCCTLSYGLLSSWGNGANVVQVNIVVIDDVMRHAVDVAIRQWLHTAFTLFEAMFSDEEKYHSLKLV